MTRQRVVVATGNPGKVSEIAAILANPEVELLSLAGFPSLTFPAEGGDYSANAMAKAKAAASQLGEFAVADDSGIEVAALDGAPGPYSARYGGPGLDDAGRMRALLEALEGVEPAERGARYVCVAAFATPSGDCISCFGECRGTLLQQPRGRAGFGYDPIFEIASGGLTMAEISPQVKNQISHRARAFQELSAVLARMSDS